MNTITAIDIATIYEHTTAILGTASLIMGITLLVLRCALKNKGMRSKSGLGFLAAAMFVLSIINLLEYIVGIESHQESHSLSIVIFAASTEMFLIFMAYMSMLCKKFATRWRIYFEIECIVLFTTAILFVSPDNHPLLFDILFFIGITFYCVKFIFNYIAYRKQMKKIRERIKNFLIDDSSIWLQWINNTFYVILAIGIISIIAPMTNLTILIFYNISLLVAYFYIYLSIIRKIFIFDKNMAILERYELDSAIE